MKQIANLSWFVPARWGICLALFSLILLMQAVPTPAAASVTEISPEEIIAATNNVRDVYQRHPLSNHPALQLAAVNKALQMSENSEFAHHLSGDTSIWSAVEQSGYQYRSLGENLAVHFTQADSVVDAWMNSPAHKQNLLSENYDDIGVGVAAGTWQGYRGYFIVQLFGTPIERST